MDASSIEKLTIIKELCTYIYQNPNNLAKIEELQRILSNTNTYVLKIIKPFLLAAFLPIIKNTLENKNSFKVNEKQAAVETLKLLFDKTTLDNLPTFFNIYGFLLFEMYNVVEHKILKIPEEYKLSLVECMMSLARSLDTELIPQVYAKENVSKLCQIIYVLLQYAKNEGLKSLQIASINCIMAIARVLDDDDFSDVVTRDKIADLFLYFLPGVASQLKEVALSDEKIGHKIPATALKAWGRIITLMMQDYNPVDSKLKFFKPETETPQFPMAKWNDEKQVKEYIEKGKRSYQWFKSNDQKLQKIVVELSKLTFHSHPNVRLELVKMASLIIENCFNTIPLSISHLVEIVITLSQDDDESVAKEAKKILDNLSKKFVSEEFKPLLENLEEGFYNSITRLPRKFNGIDEREQMTALNLVSGYINLFGEQNLIRVLHSSTHLNLLIQTLIHISEIENSSVSSLEEYSTQELEPMLSLGCPWKKFRHFKDDKIQKKLEFLCFSLAKFGAYNLILDTLFDIINTNVEQRKEATFIINEMVSGIDPTDNEMFKNIIMTYTDKNVWNLPLKVMVDDLGYEHTLGEIKDNIIQVCLLVDGIGKVALARGEKFDEFLLKTLYLVLERAGSNQPMIRLAGLTALNNITIALGYSNITELINKNIDYFSFHVERKLNRVEENENVLNVFAVVMKYSTIEVLQTTSDIIRELLMQSCDKNKETKANAYLRVFKIFIQCLKRWLNVTVDIPSFKTKAEKLAELEHFKVSNWEQCNDFSDDIMEKSAEEMYEEDMKKKKEELDNEVDFTEPEEYKKPDPPMEIKISVAILSRCLHFLPSKDKTRKLLVLEILRDGVEIIKNWEDELLPIVHQIWSPLVERFKEFEEPVIINYSFQLLMILARLSKEFIRSRTAKEVLPSLLKLMDKLSKDSYLKDAGSAYRYTQAYKLQLLILENLVRIIIDLDMLEKDIVLAMKSVFRYLSDKQPLPLQKEALKFFDTLIKYDPDITKNNLESLRKEFKNIECEKNIKMLLE